MLKRALWVMLGLAACKPAPPPVPPPPPCPKGPSREEITVARRWLEDAGHGEHEVGLGDGGCFVLWERRNENGPREWKLFELTRGGPRLRKRIELGLKPESPDKCAEHLEKPRHWHNDNFWVEYADSIETCVEDGDAGDVRCFGAAIH